MEEQEKPTIISCGQQARMYSDVTAEELAGQLFYKQEGHGKGCSAMPSKYDKGKS